MTKPEGETSAVKTSEVEKVQEGVGSVFLERVSEIPVVNTAKEYSSAAYNQIKQFNKFTTYALTAAETTALYLAVTAKPFLEKVQPQAQLVDHFACRGLDVVEEKAPFLLKPPEQLIEDARKLCSSTVESGYQKVENLKAAGTDTLTSVKNYGLQKANDYLVETDGLVDKYLPPAFGEGSQEAQDDGKTVQERATKLTSKIGLRVYGHGVKQLLSVHKISQDSVAKLVYTVELLQQIKENYSNKSVQEYVDEAKVKANWIWDELNKEPAESKETEKSLEQRMLSLARRMTSVLVHAYNVTAVPLANAPQAYRDGVTTASKYAAELFSQFDQATNVGETTVTLLQNARDKLLALQKVAQGLGTQVEEIEMESVGPNQLALETEAKSEAGSSK